MNNESGFTYPTTLIIILLLFFSLSYATNGYLSEKRHVTEQQHLLLLESLLQISVVDFIHFWNETPQEITKVFSYEHGTVTLRIENEEELVYVTLVAQLDSGHRRAARFYYNESTNELEEYWEVS
ncbi:competence type IV pilus minor pilin ComGG [Bacillus solitudinis]|uniref:competence type IV pilus minor pilin ComGG n=1 Tax=Bacillus solitudinis TaxID=2014074 RepID=UPI000C235CD0|nr:competence type IV pilus minor pilin ComGG [Bacillus solitudinis]